CRDVSTRGRSSRALPEGKSHSQARSTRRTAEAAVLGLQRQVAGLLPPGAHHAEREPRLAPEARRRRPRSTPERARLDSPPALPPHAPDPAGYFAGGLFTFAGGAAVGAALWGNCNWGGGDVNINSNRSDNFTRNVNNANVANDRIQHRAQGGGGQGRNQWQ